MTSRPRGGSHVSSPAGRGPRGHRAHDHGPGRRLQTTQDRQGRRGHGRADAGDDRGSTTQRPVLRASRPSSRARQGLRRPDQGRAEDRVRRRGAAEAESKVVGAIASGEVDGGWPSTRAFARGGVPGLEVVEAPMTITSYAAQKALVSGPVAGKLLARLEGSGVVGLGLAVGPLRRPFAANQPLLGPEDWKGITFRVFNSPAQADAVRALGATPADVSFSWHRPDQEGTLRGARVRHRRVRAEGQRDPSRQRHRQRRALAEGVRAGPEPEALRRPHLPAAGVGARGGRPGRQGIGRRPLRRDPGRADPLRAGARFLDATPGQLQGLRSRLRPVLDKLATDPTSAQLLGDLQAIAAQHPGPEAPAVPASCAKGVADNRVAWPGPGGGLGPPRRGVPPPAHPRRRRRRRRGRARLRRASGRSGSGAGPSS